MTKPMQSAAGRQRGEEEEAQQKEADERKKASGDDVGRSAMELNPFWKGGGDGLPTQHAQAAAVRGGGVAAPPPGAVGDGGASWRLKALKRAQVQAAAEVGWGWGWQPRRRASWFVDGHLPSGAMLLPSICGPACGVGPPLTPDCLLPCLAARSPDRPPSLPLPGAGAAAGRAGGGALGLAGGPHCWAGWGTRCAW